jgi:hypothetical protein
MLPNNLKLSVVLSLVSAAHTDSFTVVPAGGNTRRQGGWRSGSSRGGREDCQAQRCGVLSPFPCVPHLRFWKLKQISLLQCVFLLCFVVGWHRTKGRSRLGGLIFSVFLVRPYNSFSYQFWFISSPDPQKTFYKTYVLSLKKSYGMANVIAWVCLQGRLNFSYSVIG